MKIMKCLTAALAGLLLTSLALAQSLSPDLQAKVDAKLKELQSWSTDAKIVSAVKAYNASPSDEAKAMTNDKWKSLTVINPFVKSLAKNDLAQYLKSKKDGTISEIFVSGADGGKVAFLSKTTSWSHKGKAKHETPMSGKDWVGNLEVDESTGSQQVQVGLPVLDEGKPVGSIVIGLKASAMK